MSWGYEGLCVLTPIEPDRRVALRDLLRALPPEHSSPFARIEGTHFARFETLRLEGRDGTPVDSLPAYLLFAAEFDGPLDSYLQALIDGLGHHAHTIWGHCTGYPGQDAAALAEYLKQHRIEPGYSVVAYPDPTVDRVRSSLALAQRLHEFVVRGRGLDPVALKRAWLESFRKEPER